MTDISDYIYYKGEDICPFEASDYRNGFGHIERYHEVCKNKNFVQSLVKTFKEEFKDLKFWNESKTTQEVIALALQSMIDGGYTNIEKEINNYGSIKNIQMREL